MGTQAVSTQSGKIGAGDPHVVAKSPAPPHVLVVPYAIFSHTIPLLRLAGRLTSEAINVSFVSYEDDIPNLTAEIRAALRNENDREIEQVSVVEQLLRHGFRFVIVPRPPKKPGGGFSTDDYRRELEPHVAKFVQDKEKGIIGGPTCVLSDMFVPWTQDVAGRLQIPRYVFCSSGLNFAKLILEDVFTHDSDRFRLDKDGTLKHFDGSVTVPGLPPLSYDEIPTLHRWRPKEASTCSISFWKSAGIVINSFQELEEELIESWSTSGAPQRDYTKVPRIYMLGPFFLETPVKAGPTSSGQEASKDPSIRWLDSQAPSSVLYVAFGTQERLSVEQQHELALGLEASEQPFLWVIPTDDLKGDLESTSVFPFLPQGFQERVGNRACVVVGFVPQLQVLDHPSVGGFLTHAGWNSSLEAVVHGVPMIAWPLGKEQRLNCRYLVDQLKIAHEMQTDSSNIAGRDQAEKAVRQVLVGSGRHKLKTKMEELRQRAAIAVSEGGSQTIHFQNFITDIRHMFTIMRPSFTCGQSHRET